jgi:outer membrane autotransporter protein
MVGYQDAKIDTVRGSRLTLQGGQAGLYGLMTARDFHFQASLVGGKDQMDVDRVSNGGLAKGETDGGVFSGMVGAGYRTTQGRWGLRPSVSLQYTRVSMGAFEETGSATPLIYEGQSGSSFLGTLGAQGTGDFHLGRHLTLRPGLAASCLYEMSDEGGEVLSAIHGAAFTVKGCKVGSSGMRLGVSLEAQWKKDVGLTFRYQEDVGCDNFDAKTYGGHLRFNL